MALLTTEKDNPVAIAGDQVRLVINRGGKQIELAYVLGPPDWFRMAEQSARCSGFSQVHSVTAASGSKLLGGPVVDRHGHLLGVAIAWRNSGWLLVLPASAAKSVGVN